MAVDDTQLYDSLDTVIDMDAFLTYWAMDLITGHWDSYSGDQNNIHVYHDPKSDKFYFVPWGTDGAFNSGHGFLPPDIPKSVYAWSWLTYRLYSNPDARSKYRDRLRSLLDTIWDQGSLLSEIDRIGELTEATDASLEQQRQFIRDRKQSILDELDSGDPDWAYAPKTGSGQYSVCIPTFPIDGQFDTMWGDVTTGLFSKPPNATPNAFEIHAGETRTWQSYDLHTDEIAQQYSSFLASAGAAKGNSHNLQAGIPQVTIVGVPSTTGPMVVVVLVFDPQQVGVKELSFHAFENVGVVVHSTGSNGENDVILGYIGDGKVVFDQVGQQSGDRVKESFSCVFVPLIFDQIRRSSTNASY